MKLFVRVHWKANQMLNIDYGFINAFEVKHTSYAP